MIDGQRLRELDGLAEGEDEDVILQITSEKALCIEDPLVVIDDWVDEKLGTMAFQEAPAAGPDDIDELAEDAGF